MKRIFLIMLHVLIMIGYSHAENTDVSIYDNVVYIPPFTVSSGAQATVSICMKNTALIRSFQFDLYLPNGISVVKSNKGRIQGTLNPVRLPEEDQHLLTFSEQPDGAIRFLCGSEYDEIFVGNDGEIASLLIDVSADMGVGEYPIYIAGITLSETDIKNHYDTELIETSITIGEPADTRTVLDENSTTVPAAATNVDVRVKRTIHANEWSTIVLPFAMSEAQVKEVFGNDVQLGDFTGTDSDFDVDDNCVAIKANFDAVTAIEANHPYIIKVSQPVEEFTVDGVDINADEDEAYFEFDNGKSGSRRVVYSGFYGTYHAGTVLDKFTLFLNNNKFWYSMGQTKMKAFRAYFGFLDVLTEVENASNIKMWVNSDDATDIKAIDHSSAIDHNYNLAGQRVSKNYKGIVVNKNKKVLK